MRDLRGRNAILTGASRGLGVTIARTLAREGINLALAARSKDDLERVRDEVVGLGVKAISVPTDVTDREALGALVRQATDELGPTDILVNNAGVEYVAPFHEYPPDDIESVVNVNLLAPMLLTRFVLPGMIERGRGQVVFVASLAGKGGFPCEAPYAATKSALITFNQTLRAELVDTPIGCSAVAPGFVADDGMYARLAEGGIKAPRMLGTTTPGKVADAVLKAIRSNPAELIVNPTPMRPLLALAEVFPGLIAPVQKWLGVTEFARRSARAVDEGPV